MTALEAHPRTGQPVGLPVEKTTPAPRPGPVTLKGRYGRLEKLAPAHAADLWSAFAGHDHVWTYIARDGPFADAAAFSSFLGERAASQDPYAYAIIDAADRAVGYVTLLRIVPDMRVIEVGHVLYSPALQRTPLATETQYRVTSSRLWATGATSGNATLSTQLHGAPPCATGSSMKGRSAST